MERENELHSNVLGKSASPLSTTEIAAIKNDIDLFDTSSAEPPALTENLPPATTDTIGQESDVEPSQQPSSQPKKENLGDGIELF
jgi:hypothetical protein